MRSSGPTSSVGEGSRRSWSFVPQRPAARLDDPLIIRRHGMRPRAFPTRGEDP